jgi:creatinine amidohydrolase
MKNPLRWDNLTWPEIKQASEAAAIVILPVGSTEQHGPHLPVGCDAILATALAERTAAALRDKGVPALVAPTIAVGNSVHHMGFPGAITLWPKTFMDALSEQCRCIARHGFTKIILFNGHGGNFAPMNVTLISLNAELGFPVFDMGYWEAAPDDFDASVLESQRGIIHACEAETSLMLAINEDLVDPIYKETKGPMHQAPTAAENAGAVHTFRRMDEETPNGVMGNSYLATKAKGEKMVATYVATAADALAGLWAEKAEK